MKPEKPNKQTIYIDVDDEITAIIDKVRTSPDQIVALVLPKRAAVFHSVVNMKLLKRAADQEKKNAVLITSEPSVLPLAGTVGLHVAANLSSKPFVPAAPEIEAPKALDADEVTDDSSSIDRNTAVGSLLSKDKKSKKEDEPIEIDNRPKEEAATAVAATEAAKAATSKKKLKVPDFKKFRTLLIAGGVALIALVLFGYWALAIAPRATITVRGETSEASLAFDIIADTEASTLDESKNIIPSKLKEIKKTESEKVPATGQKDKGNKASGTVSLKNCAKSDGSASIPAGTGISAGDLTFITQAPVNLEPSEFSGGGNCKSEAKEVAVIAQQPGDKYNVAARSYTVAGFTGVNASGSAMTGGTSQIVKVVSASDVETAKQKLASKQVGVTEELKAGLDAEGYIGLPETFSANTPKYTPTPAVDSEAVEVIVNAESIYTMLGIKTEDLQKVVKKEADGQENIDTEKQSILSDGLKDATYNLGAKKGARTPINVQTRVVAGPDIKEDEIKSLVAGKKRGEAEQLIKDRPGIKEVKITTKPFWNYSVPKKPTKIQLIIEEANGKEITQ